jgi:hypothetical protein
VGRFYNKIPSPNPTLCWNTDQSILYMLKPIAPLIFLAVLSSACSERQATSGTSGTDRAVAEEIAGLKVQIAKLEKENADLRNTPSAMLVAVRAAGSDLTKADAAAIALRAKFPDSSEAKQAEGLVLRMKAEQAARDAEAKRMATLGLKALKVSSTLVGDEATISLSGVSQTRRWTFDAYDSSIHYRDAEKGSAFIVARVKASSDNKDPGLPGAALYRSEGATLKRVALFSYKFVTWQDFGSYLGNYADYGNDFAHTNVIPMSIGADATLANLARPLFVVATKEGCHKSQYERFSQPPVSYRESECSSLKETLEVNDFNTGRIAVVHRLD